MIKGGRISTKTRKINKRTHSVKRGSKILQIDFAKFVGTAYCVIESQPAGTYNIGDALKGEIITGEADDIGRIKVTSKEGTSSHKIQTTLLSGNATCVINRPLRHVREALTSREKK